MAERENPTVDERVEAPCQVCLGHHWVCHPCIHEPVVRERDELRGFIARRGYRRCDIAVCNCGSFHGGYAEDRLREIHDELGDLVNGLTALKAVGELRKYKARFAWLVDPENTIHYNGAQWVAGRIDAESDGMLFWCDGASPEEAIDEAMEAGRCQDQ